MGFIKNFIDSLKQEEKVIDDNIYIGKFNEEGHLVEGKIKFKDGSVYEGNFDNSKLIEGKKIGRDGSILEGKFDKKGYLINGKKTILNGNIYEGKFNNQGQLIEGSIKFKDGTVYEGKFENGYLVEGRIIRKNGNIEEGRFKNNYLIQGKVIWPNGNIGEEKIMYKNENENEEKIKHKNESEKVLSKIKINGHIYEVNIENEEFKNGEIIRKNGYMEKGKFENGELKEGGRVWLDGTIHEGKFENGELKEGRRIWQYGVVKEERGKYKNSNLKEGKKIWSDGYIEDGKFENGFFLRDGKKIWPNGKIEIFKDGKLIKSNENIKNDLNISSIDKFTYSKNINKIPKENNYIIYKNFGKIRLKDKVASGGEGTIYKIDNDYVCKIYKKEKINQEKYNKIKLMTEKNINIEGVCWPIDIAYNEDNQFVGYIMKKATGVEIQKSVFLKPLLNKNFPQWKRIDLVDATISILEKINELHKQNIIIGDINPLNILIKSPNEVYFVDTDSYQIEKYPCPVGTVNFTAPEIQGKDYKNFLRSYGNEYFAVTTLVFMMMLPGKPPYSQQGGSNPYINIKNMDFSYPYNGQNNNKTPEGPWKTMWENLPDYMKKYFYESFMKNGKFSSENERISTEQWVSIMKMYRMDLSNKMFDKEDMYKIFP